MQKSISENKNIIHSKGIIDDNCMIISADEEFYRFVGPNIKIFTDSVHQVDLDDFLYVLEQLNAFAPKSLVLRIRRFDNTYRWCLATISKYQFNIDGKEHIEIEISDVINLNNHYIALTRMFDNNKEQLAYDSLMDAQEVFEIARNEIASENAVQINLIYFGIDNTEEMVKNYGRDFYNKMLDEISAELKIFVGERGCVAHYDEGNFLVMLKNVGNESNLRSFVESSRSKLRWMYVSQNSALNVDFTIGIAEYPRNGKTFEIIEKKLNKARELANDKGGNCYIIYKEELHGEI